MLLDPAFDPALTSSAQDDIVVEVHTDEAIVGIGETDLNAWIVRQGWALASGDVGNYRSEQYEAEAARRGIWFFWFRCGKRRWISTCAFEIAARR